MMPDGHVEGQCMARQASCSHCVRPCARLGWHGTALKLASVLINAAEEQGDPSLHRPKHCRERLHGESIPAPSLSIVLALMRNLAQSMWNEALNHG